MDQPAVDLLIRGGTVRSTPIAPPQEAMAIRDGRVVALGSQRDLAGLVGDRTMVHDLGGRTAVPGFIETHNHPMFYGLTLEAAVDAGSPPNDRIADIVDRVADAVRDAEPGEWVRGYRYDDTLLADDRHPTRVDLDSASPQHPVCLMHISGHFCVLNSAGLAAVGVTRGTADPPGGLIVRDESGEPTGVLVETAAFAAYAAMPAAGLDDYVAALDRACDSYLSHGVTTVHDLGIGLVGGDLELQAYARALQSRRPRPRVRGYVVDSLLPERPEEGSSLEAVAGIDPDRFRVVGAKLWADGSIQVLTGCLDEGYACAPDQHGFLLHQPEALAARVATLVESELQPAVHGNGDRAIGVIIDAYRALGTTIDDDLRPRLEHCQMVREEQLDAMVELGIHASFFVKHVYYWGDRHRDRFLGPERAARLSPLASARRRGMRFGLHSDTPVVPVSPLEGMWVATTRQTRDGHLLGPDQVVSAEAALAAYTSEAAYLAHEESTAGRLVEGMVADLAVLDTDPLAGGDRSYADNAVHSTYVSGERVWQRGDIT